MFRLCRPTRWGVSYGCATSFLIRGKGIWNAISIGKLWYHFGECITDWSYIGHASCGKPFVSGLVHTHHKASKGTLAGSRKKEQNNFVAIEFSLLSAIAVSRWVVVFGWLQPRTLFPDGILRPEQFLKRFSSSSHQSLASSNCLQAISSGPLLSGLFSSSRCCYLSFFCCGGQLWRQYRLCCSNDRFLEFVCHGPFFTSGDSTGIPISLRQRWHGREGGQHLSCSNHLQTSLYYNLSAQWFLAVLLEKNWTLWLITALPVDNKILHLATKLKGSW